MTNERWPVHGPWSDDPAPAALPALAEAGYGPAAHDGSATARRWWDAEAAGYLAEHGDALGDVAFTWGPEGLTEADAGALGDLTGARVLEVGAGSAPCARWLHREGVDVVASDLSHAMLRAALEANRRTGVDVPLVQADALALPFAAGSFDVVFTSYGVVPFVADAAALHREVARVLRPGGRWAFSTTHPVRWAFPDDPGPGGLTATRSYFDADPYRELDADGGVVYAEYHRTLAQHVADVTSAGLRITRLVEPTWQPGRETWGGWSELRARHLPGTLLLVAEREW